MSRVYIEQRQLKRGSSLSGDVAHHLYSRQANGKVLIIAKKPAVFLANLKRHWLKLTHQVTRERSLFSNPGHIQELDRQLSYAQTATFTMAEPFDKPNADIFVVGLDKLDGILPYCHTLYVTCEVNAATLEMLIGAMPDNSLAIIYL